ncbi:hypothetical protein CR513_19509, partial [Mucuna pruriens]
LQDFPLVNQGIFKVIVLVGCLSIADSPHNRPTAQQGQLPTCRLPMLAHHEVKADENRGWEAEISNQTLALKLIPTTARGEKLWSRSHVDHQKSGEFHQRRRGGHARSDEQSRLSAEAEERYRQAEERHLGAMRAAERREEELHQQIATLKAVNGQDRVEYEGDAAQPFWGQPFCKEIDETPIPPNFKEVVVEPFDGSQDPYAHLQTFQTQMYISGGNDRLSCKLFPGTLRGVAMQWIATPPPRSIQTFKDLAGSFVSQFAANKVKKLEIADLFDIKQTEGESLKSYLARFNNATVRVDDPNQKFFVKAF